MNYKHALLIIPLLFLHFNITQAQEAIKLSGRILDKDTKQPLNLAHIIAKSSMVGVVSNDNGEFMLNLNSAKIETIIIRHIGYKTVEFIAEKLPKIILLTPENNLLEDFYLESTKNKDKSNLAKQAIILYDSLLNRNSHIGYFHFKEKGYKSQECIMYYESLGYALQLDFSIPYPKLGNYTFVSDNSRAFVENPLWKELDKKTNDKYNRRNVRPSSDVLLNSLRKLQTRGILSPSLLSKYKFSEKEITDNERVVYFTFKGNGEKGTISIDLLNLEIRSLELESKKTVFSLPFDQSVKANINFEFHYFNSQPYLLRASTSYSHMGYKHIIELQSLAHKFASFDLKVEELRGFGAIAFNPYLNYDKKEFLDEGIEVDLSPEEIRQITKGTLFEEKEDDFQFMQGWLDPTESEKQKNQLMALIKKIERLKRLFK